MQVRQRNRFSSQHFVISRSLDFFYIESALELSYIAAGRSREPISSAESLSIEGPRQACVIGAIACSVSFLECTINGLYEDAIHAVARPTRFHRSLASVWSDAFDRQPILAKYQLALTLARREQFKTSGEPYQSAAALIDLRNAIAHPKEITASERHQAKLEKTLRGKYVFHQPDEGPNYSRAFFPDHCLSQDCSTWAVRTAAAFALEFRKRLPPTAYAAPRSFVDHLKEILKQASEAPTARL